MRYFEVPATDSPLQAGYALCEEPPPPIRAALASISLARRRNGFLLIVMVRQFAMSEKLPKAAIGCGR
jgi:hypothetical protein